MHFLHVGTLFLGAGSTYPVGHSGGGFAFGSGSTYPVGHFGGGLAFGVGVAAHAALVKLGHEAMAATPLALALVGGDTMRPLGGCAQTMPPVRERPTVRRWYRSFHASMLQRLWTRSVVRNRIFRPPISATTSVSRGVHGLVRGLFDMYHHRTLRMMTSNVHSSMYCRWRRLGSIPGCDVPLNMDGCRVSLCFNV